MTNQFVNRTKPEVLQAYLDRGPHAATIRELHKACLEQPTLCRVPDGPNLSLWFTYEGARHRIAVRTLVYFVEHGSAPVFKPCSCGNKGCINPFHQQLGNDVQDALATLVQAGTV